MFSKKRGTSENGENGSESFGVSSLEVLLAALVTFSPFILVSIPILENDKAADFFPKFAQYFDAGEVVLPIFSVCGAIYATVALNHRKLTRSQVWWPAVGCLLVILFSGLVLGRTAGFTAKIGLETNIGLFILYVIFLGIWWRALYVTKKEPEEPPTPDQNADKLLSDLASKRVGQS